MLNSLSLLPRPVWLDGRHQCGPASQPDCLPPSLPPSLPARLRACVRACLPTWGACLPRVCRPGITSGCISGNPFKETLRVSGQSKARMAEPAEPRPLKVRVAQPVNSFTHTEARFPPRVDVVFVNMSAPVAPCTASATAPYSVYFLCTSRPRNAPVSRICKSSANIH